MPQGYPSIELGTPGKPACPDNYSAASTVSCGGARKLRVQTSSAACVIQFGEGWASPVFGPEETLLPTVGSIVRSFDAVRVRNLVAGIPAQVILTPSP